MKQWASGLSLLVKANNINHFSVPLPLLPSSYIIKEVSFSSVHYQDTRSVTIGPQVTFAFQDG